MVYLSISNTIYFKNREKEQMQRIKAVRAVIYYARKLKLLVTNAVYAK